MLRKQSSNWKGGNSMVDYPAWFWSSGLQASVKLVGGMAALPASWEARWGTTSWKEV